MMRSLWTAASGMIGQQANIDTVANNLANVNTNGFKKNRVDFEDLIYQTEKVAGLPATEETVTPVGIQVGLGVKAASTQKIFEQGSLQATNVKEDLALSGEGFFRVLLMDGTYGYTRDGSFKVDAEGQLVTSNGNRILPEVILPREYIHESLTFSEQGEIAVKMPGMEEDMTVGQIRLFRFVNPAGLKAIGANMFKKTIASGESIGGNPGGDGMGKTIQGFLEMSNVSVAKEMVNMIVAQRAYEFNSKAIQTSDAMLGIANNLKR